MLLLKYWIYKQVSSFEIINWNRRLQQVVFLMMDLKEEPEMESKEVKVEIKLENDKSGEFN